MAAKPRWWSRISDIVAQLDSIGAPIVDRAVVEEVFGVRRRQAIKLLNKFGGFQLGRTFAIDRQALVERLRRTQEEPEVRQERGRRQRLSEMLGQLKQDAQSVNVTIPVDPATFYADTTALPEGVTVQSGRLTVEFRSAADLLGKLYSVARSAAVDLEAFEKLVDPNNK